MRVRVSRVLHVNRVAYRRDFAGHGIGLAIAGPCHVIDLFEDLAALGPALDDLNAVEIAIVRVLDGPHDEGWRLSGLSWKIASHRHAVGIAGLHPIFLVQYAQACSPSRRRSAP